MRKCWDAFNVPGLPEDFQLYEVEVFRGGCNRKLVLTGSVPGYGTCATIEQTAGEWAEPMLFHGQALSLVRRIIVALDVIEAWLLAGGLEAADAETLPPEPEPPKPPETPQEAIRRSMAETLKKENHELPEWGRFL